MGNTEDTLVGIIFIVIDNTMVINSSSIPTPSTSFLQAGIPTTQVKTSTQVFPRPPSDLSPWAASPGQSTTTLAALLSLSTPLSLLLGGDF